jgi:peroxiredoxin
MFHRAFLTLAFITSLGAQPLPVPRKAAEFVISSIDGQKLPLSGYRGKVVVVSFIHTTCPHCQQLCTTMNQLNAEYSAQGFQPIAIAWNDRAQTLAPEFAKVFRLNYPLGYSDRPTVLGYLGISMLDQRLVVPQMIWIDRKGVIRAQTPVAGDHDMLTDSYFRQTITTLLAEPGPSSTTAKPTHRPVANTKR